MVDQIAFDYPITLALAFLFLAGYFTNRLFVALKLPGAVGVIFAGFLFHFFMEEHILEARHELQELTFFLVLLTAGFEILLPDLNWAVFVMSWVPVLFEILGLHLVGRIVRGWPPVESIVCACVLCGLGDGLVIPKMRAFTQEFPGHTMPRLLFTWAPLEASLVLTLFGMFTPMACPEGMPEISYRRAMVVNLVVVVATLIFGSLLGCGCAKCIENRPRLAVANRKVFTGTTVEAYLMIFSTALFAFGCGSTNEHGEPFIPLGFAPGPLLQPELLVIVTGSVFSYFVDHQILHNIEATAGGVWVFGQLILFAMLGSKSRLEDLEGIVDVSPFMISGLTFRFFGTALSMLVARKKLKRPPDAFWSDVLFGFVSVLPRATLQGALGSVPKAKAFFSQNEALGNEIKLFIHDASRLYILLFSVLGSILVDTVGHQMLMKTFHRANSNENSDWAESALSVRRRKTATSVAAPSFEANTIYSDAEFYPMCQMDTVVYPLTSQRTLTRKQHASEDESGIDLAVMNRISEQISS